MKRSSVVALHFIALGPKRSKPVRLVFSEIPEQRIATGASSLVWCVFCIGGSLPMYPITRKGWEISEECAILLAAYPRSPHQS